MKRIMVFIVIAGCTVFSLNTTSASSKSAEPAGAIADAAAETKSARLQSRNESQATVEAKTFLSQKNMPEGDVPGSVGSERGFFSRFRIPAWFGGREEGGSDNIGKEYPDHLEMLFPESKTDSLGSEMNRNPVIPGGQTETPAQNPENE